MWGTKRIIKSINTKDKMYKKLVQSRYGSYLCETLKAHFNKYRNILKKTIIAKAKRIYYVDVFNRFKNNIKQTWKVIKETLHKNNFAKISKKFRQNGKIIDNPQEIADAFNLYFINIGPIAEQINSNRSHRDYLTKSCNSTLSLTNINENYVASLIDCLKNKESSIIDRLSNKHPKAAKNLLAKPLTLLINQMLNTGIFSSKLKQSKVTPIFKVKDKELLSNYRPGLGSSTVDQVLKYIKYLKYIASTSTGQVLIF